MGISRLHELLPAFIERNNVLALLLGLKSLSDRWMRLLESQAASARREHPAPPDSESVHPDLGLIYTLLGTISFSRNFHPLLQALPRPQEANDEPQDSMGDLRGLLR